MPNDSTVVPCSEQPKIGGAWEAVVYNWPYVRNADGTVTSFGPGTPEYACLHALQGLSDTLERMASEIAS